MKKRGKNKKGFTMIELMIVITVIGILAIVLLPRLGSIRNEARNSGVESNFNTVIGVLELEIARSSEVSTIVERVKERLTEAGIENPITGSKEITSDVNGDSEATKAPAVHISYDEGTGEGDNVPKDYDESNGGGTHVGLIGVNIGFRDGRIEGEVYGYNHEGDHILGKVDVRR